MAVAIRIAAIPDAPALARVHVTSWLETYRGIVPDKILKNMSVERRAEAWLKILSDPENAKDTTAFVAELAGEIVGFGACGAQRTPSLLADGYDGEFGSIYVLQTYQRRGIGKSLMATMTADLADRGFQGAGLWVLRDNHRARQFYEQCDGKIVAEKSDVRGEAVLIEVAYGWQDVKVLRNNLSQ